MGARCAWRSGRAACTATLFGFVAALVAAPASAERGANNEHPTEVLINLAVGLGDMGGTLGPTFRLGVSGTRWLTPGIGVGLQGMIFSNIDIRASDNLACPAGQTCNGGDTRGSSGWLLEPRFFIGTTMNVVRFYTALGLGLADENVRAVPNRSLSPVGSLEGGVNVHLGRISVVPALRVDAMAGATSALLQLGVGANL
jgi:hypothetical protein